MTEDTKELYRDIGNVLLSGKGQYLFIGMYPPDNEDTEVILRPNITNTADFAVTLVRLYSSLTPEKRESFLDSIRNISTVLGSVVITIDLIKKNTIRSN